MISNYFICEKNFANLLLGLFYIIYTLSFLVIFFVRKYRTEWWTNCGFGKYLEKNLFKDPISGWFSFLGLAPSVTALYFFWLSLRTEEYWEISALFAIVAILFFFLSEVRLWRVEASKMHRISYLPRLIFYRKGRKLYLQNIGGGVAINVWTRIGNSPPGFKKDFLTVKEPPIEILEIKKENIPFKAEVYFHSPLELQYNFHTTQLIDHSSAVIKSMSWSEGMEKNGECEIDIYHEQMLRKKLDELLKKWEERESKNNKESWKKWEENGRESRPGDYLKDKNGTTQRKREKDDVLGLQKIIPNGIIFVDWGERNKNCHAYTISNVPELKIILNSEAKALENGKRFLLWLKEKKLLKESSKGKIVLYFKDDNFTHSGIVEKDLVKSKWNAGNIYKHGLFEVPLRYGDPQRFKLIGTNKELEQFKKTF